MSFVVRPGAATCPRRVPLKFDIAYVRSQFPALENVVNGRPAVYFDGPGGTQMPRRVVDRMVEYILRRNSNTGGVFAASEATDKMLLDARHAFGDYFGCAWDEVSFCHNSTTISFKLAEAIARDLRAGDEVLLTDIDHEANRGPWEILAERGIVVRSVRLNPETCTLDMADFANKLNSKTKVVAFNWASNALGTISDAKAIARMAREAGAVSIVDAVHYALHGTIDVRDVGMDYLFCSAYKFFGPHVGVLYAKRERMEKLRTLRVGAQEPTAPHKFETGTLNHEGIAGAAEAVDFMADLGAHHGAKGGRRAQVIAGVDAMEHHEQPLAARFKEELRRIPGLRLYTPPAGHPCTSTISFTLEGRTPKEVSTRLGEKGIFTWNGGFYAVHVVRTLGLADKGGLVRIGLAPYNTAEEVDRALDEIRAIAKG